MTWSACERLGILPPDTKLHFNDNDIWVQCQIIAYGQIRDIEESEQPKWPSV